MTLGRIGLCVGLAVAASLSGTSVHALTLQECSTKYKAAQTGGTLKGMKWNEFRKAECGADATAAPSSAPGTATPSAAKPAAPVTTTGRTSVPTPSASMPPSSAVFPNAVSPKYSSESAGKSRMHTCLDQYNANKATNANGGLRWIQKGGGYYSECNKRLKG